MLYLWKDDTLILTLYVIPNAKKDEVIGPYLDALKIKITAVAQDNKANEHLIKLMAKWFDVPKSQITLLKGAHSRQKRIEIIKPKKIPKWMNAL